MVITFLENKYTKWYYLIVNSALTRNNAGYSERHHIIPKSLGGSNEQSNIVTLSAREHFVCHRLLTKMVSGINKRKMSYAVWLLCNAKNSTQQKRHIPNSFVYQQCREEYVKSMSQSLRGVKKTKIHWLNKKHTDETKAKQSEVKRGANNPMFGRTQSEETVNKIKQAQINIPKPKFTCERCGKVVGGKSNFLRWHGNNCKEKQNY